MMMYARMLVLVLVLAASLSVPAFAQLCENQMAGGEVSPEGGCGGGGGGDGGGGSTPPPPAYTLQGVIQLESSDRASNGWRYAKVRGYSRLANQRNDRVDANFISVYCVARSTHGESSDYDDERNGALVDVTFRTPGVPPFTSATIQVDCVHKAEKNGVAYDTSSTTQFVVRN